MGNIFFLGSLLTGIQSHIHSYNPRLALLFCFMGCPSLCLVYNHVKHGSLKFKGGRLVMPDIVWALFCPYLGPHLWLGR